MNCLGSFICYIIYGYLISAVGSKRATLLLTIPSLLGWSLIYFGDNYYYVLLGRFFGGGVSGAATATVSLYVTEIANDNIRGQLSCLSMFLRNIGILLAYIIGSTLPYTYVPCICLVVPGISSFSKMIIHILFLFFLSSFFFHPFCTITKYMFVLSWPRKTTCKQSKKLFESRIC